MEMTETVFSYYIYNFQLFPVNNYTVYPKTRGCYQKPYFHVSY